ncbi:UDP-glucose dehydrogenase family protein [Radiobacillus sp. PE A8.2]|uniref:UDP-glucose dehydrogenase family protein n=1 Tax=Radiobacillus sp. PE A8.2 TaxID=3380349 RepID=UPI00388F6515
MRISVIGAGYLGLVTSVSLAQIGHNVVGLEPDRDRAEQLKNGLLPLYEPGLKGLMKTNMNEERLSFTHDRTQALNDTDVIYIAVETPLLSNGRVDLTAVEQASIDIATTISQPVIVVIKSTVPLGTLTNIEKLMKKHTKIPFQMVINPDFSRQGNAVHDTFYGDRIVLGAVNDQAANVVEEINIPFQIPIFKTDISSAEIIKYASNAFLATKISFINDIARLCENAGANIDDVAFAIGLDDRIGRKFLGAGLGYGASFFPHEVAGIEQAAENVDYRSSLLESVLRVNNNQHSVFMKKAKEVMDGEFLGKKVALLGLSRKPKTDDVRGAISIRIANYLLDLGANVTAFDPKAIPNAMKVLPEEIEFASTIEEALIDADVAFIMTDWDQFKDLPLSKYEELMNRARIIDGRNCYPLDYVRNYKIEYHSFGRPPVWIEEESELKQ